MEDVTKRKVSRRTLLKGAAAAAAIPIAAACVGSSTSTSTTAPAATAAGSGTKAPVKLSGNLNILQWSHFVPDFDTYLDKWAADWGAKNGVTVKIDRIPQADLPARFAAEVAAKSGHDVIAHFANGLPALFTTSLVDVTDICDRAANKYGGWLPAGEAIGKVKGKWYGFPDFAVPFLSSWRTDYWKAAGFNGDHLATDESNDGLQVDHELPARDDPLDPADGRARRLCALPADHLSVGDRLQRQILGDRERRVVRSEHTLDPAADERCSANELLRRVTSAGRVARAWH